MTAPVRPPARWGTGLALAGALATLALALAGCSTDRRFPTADDLADLDVTPRHTVTVDAGGFSPDELVVTSGEAVLLRNDGDGEHSFSAEDRFDTGLLRPGEATVLRLEEPGEIPYVDRATGAEGTLTVEPSG